ncbi:MAG: lamin tail domain-containing protein, partial [Bacteroidota bacterium]
MKNIFIHVLFLLSSIQIYSQGNTVLISEVMFNPVCGSCEFIELYNYSNSLSIDLTNYKIKYYTSSSDLIVSHEQGIILKPKSYAVIFEGDYDFTVGDYRTIIPNDALVLKIDNNSFGSSGMANSTSRDINLISSLGDTVFSHTYIADNESGYSEEKKVMNIEDSVWLNSSVKFGTPGFGNSISDKKNDIGIIRLSFSPLKPSVLDTIQFNGFIKNFGSELAEKFRLHVFHDQNFNRIEDAGERVFTEQFILLNKSDSVKFEYIAFNLAAASHQFGFVVNYLLDEKKSNDTAFVEFKVAGKPRSFGDIIVNEIMYNPLGDEPEWIEIYNNSLDSINIKNWKISDNSSSVIISKIDYILTPKEYIIIADDSTLPNYYDIPSRIININLPSLNNTGDKLLLTDSLNRFIDTLNYKSSWNGNAAGYSIERIDFSRSSNISSNWGKSISSKRATPGQVNSISKKEFDISFAQFSFKNNFAVIGNSAEAAIEIKNSGKNLITNCSLKLYSDKNHNGLPDINEIIFSKDYINITADESRNEIVVITNFTEGINTFIAEVKTEPEDYSDNNLKFAQLKGVKVNEVRGDLIINELHFAPTFPEPEWVEIYNRSDKLINLKGYKIADNSDASLVVKENYFISPGSFTVIAKDSIIFQLYNLSADVIVSAFPTLNNSGDDVVLMDSLSRVIDSLNYTLQWCSSGKSSERIDYDGETNNQLNWMCSIDTLGGTPGKTNSTAIKDYDLSLTEARVVTDQFENKSQRYLQVTVKNKGKNEMSFNLLLSEENYQDTVLSIIEQSSELNLARNDSLQYLFNTDFGNARSPVHLHAGIESDLDENSANNNLVYVVLPEYNEHDIIINEIMYLPEGGEPEWVELFNATESEIHIQNWIISDVITKPQVSTIVEPIVIEPKSFFVISKDSTIWDYHSELKSKVTILKFANLNNDADGVVIKDSYNNVIDSVFWDKGIKSKSGYSIEKLSSDESSLDSLNWLPSNDLEKSTPGKINSVSQKDYDLTVTAIILQPENALIGETVYPNAAIINIGKNSAYNFSVELFVSENGDEMSLDKAENLFLLPGDSIKINSSTQFIVTNEFSVKAVAGFDLDQNQSNNRMTKYFRGSYNSGECVINEFMNNPFTNEPEWIEIFQNSSKDINLKNWTISDVLTTPTKNIITAEDMWIEPGEYFVIALSADLKNVPPDVNIFKVSFGALGNLEDGILLKDCNGNTIDSLYYNSDWKSIKGRSFERVNVHANSSDITNWKIALNDGGSTTGSENSIRFAAAHSPSDILINEIMFETGEGYSEYVEFFNNTNTDINISGWSLNDYLDNLNFYPSKSIVAQGSYFLIASDSTLYNQFTLLSSSENLIVIDSKLNLSNEGESIRLKDAWGNPIDSMIYSP